MMNLRTLLYIIISIFTGISANAQQKVTFSASDGIDIRADFYETENQSHDYFLLFHQEQSSRGESKDIATRLIKLGYNCLAVDLRSGKECNFILNETAQNAEAKGIIPSLLDSEKDIEASIGYILSQDSIASIYILGSSFSASLCLKEATENANVKAVAAYSPGEYFGEALQIKQIIPKLSIPVYIGCAKSERKYVNELVSVSGKKIAVFTPNYGDGEHGSKALSWESEARNEYWLDLLLFLKKLKHENKNSKTK